MAKVISSEVVAVGSDNKGNIDSCIVSASRISEALGSFISETPSTLKGSGYDAVRIKLSLYKKIFDTAYNLLIISSTNFQNVNNSMLNYMEGYSELDDSLISEIDAKLREIKGYINYLNDAKNASVDGTNYSSLISEYNSLYNSLSHYRNLLAGLSNKDSSLYGSLENVINDIANLCRSANGINEDTFTPEGLKSNKGMYNFDKNEIIFDSSIMSNSYGKYTREEIMKMSEEQVKSMSKEEFIEFVACIARDVYAEYGGVLPSITIAQAILETGWGKHFISTTYNLYGLRGYPGSKPKVYGSSNYLRGFDNFYESTLYHYKYFQNYPNSYTTFLKECEQHKVYDAAARLGAYAGGSASYGASIQSIIRTNNLEQYDYF